MICMCPGVCIHNLAMASTTRLHTTVNLKNQTEDILSGFDIVRFVQSILEEVALSNTDDDMRWPYFMAI